MSVTRVKADPYTKQIIAAAFPGYRGRKIAIDVTEGPLNLASYWSGGSKDSFGFVRLDTMRSATMPPQSAFDPQIRGADRFMMVPGVVVVKRTIFQGHDLGITIYVHPSDVTKELLPAPEEELTLGEAIALMATASFKSSYAGIKNYRFVEANRQTGITREDWETAKAMLIRKKLLNKRGAITDAGRNALAPIEQKAFNLRGLVKAAEGQVG